MVIRTHRAEDLGVWIGLPASDDDEAEFRAEHVPGSKEYNERHGG
jgi:hypothetical protein